MKEKSQETVYVYSKSKQKSQSEAEQLESLFDTQLPFPECKASLSLRVSKYLEVKKTIEDLKSKFEIKKLVDTTEEVASWISTRPTTLEHNLAATVLLNGSTEILDDLRSKNPQWHCISINSKECPNLKMTIKLIVNRVIANDTNEMESRFSIDRRLTYDFNIIEQFLVLKNQSITRIVVFIEDTDGFDREIVQGLIDYMHSYAPQISLHLVMNVTASLDVFEERLSLENLLKLNIKCFGAVSESYQFLIRCVDILAEEHHCFIGQELVDTLKRLTLPKAAQMLIYQCLAHYSINPLALLDKENMAQYLPIILRLPSCLKQPGLLELGLPELGSAISDRLDELKSSHDAAGFLGEMIVNDTDLHRTVFAPTYRPVLETILAEPGYYEPTANRYSIPLAILYQLCRESSVFVNIYDLYTAFRELVEPGLENDKHSWEKQSLAWFLEGVAELKVMGIVRDCKRKFECIEKVSWKDV